jgi:hypothetical protein
MALVLGLALGAATAIFSLIDAASSIRCPTAFPSNWSRFENGCRRRVGAIERAMDDGPHQPAAIGGVRQTNRVAQPRVHGIDLLRPAQPLRRLQGVEDPDP